MSTDSITAVIAPLLEAFGGAKAHAPEVAAAVRDELAALVTVPPARRARYVRRIEARLLAELERLRIRGVRASRATIARVLTTALVALTTPF